MLCKNLSTAYSLFSQFSLHMEKVVTAKPISPLVKGKKVISSLVKYFTVHDIKTIPLTNNSKL